MNSAETVCTVLLAGNPNVGKSTVFNALTGMHQHTGNWSGKTVSGGEGFFDFGGKRVRLIDLPGAYSLHGGSPDEEAAAELIKKEQHRCIIMTADAGALKKSLPLCFELMQHTDRAVLCLNMWDEAERRGVRIDIKCLSDALGIPVIKTCARSGKGLGELKNAVMQLIENTEIPHKIPCREEHLPEKCKEAELCIISEGTRYSSAERKLDRLLTSKATGLPMLMLLLAVIFFITIVGANYPSQLLSYLFDVIGSALREMMMHFGVHEAAVGLFIDGIYGTLAAVISVMLPPMAIFFPLFTILEDLGYLPRVAFILDPLYSRAGTGGRQALTAMMGFGCNACGITGCRIIPDKNERIIAAVTNNFSPCNGRFPTLIAVISIFMTASMNTAAIAAAGAVILAAAVILNIGISLGVTKLLSLILCRHRKSRFILELPPYRRPQIIRTIVRSLLDRTVFVLGRAAAVAAPAGAVIWALNSITMDSKPLIQYMCSLLDAPGEALGLDGAILTGFILGFPANEIVLPVIISVYCPDGSASMQDILICNGWTIKTALCMISFTMMHFPCSTACLTLKKETGSILWTLLGFMIPTICGILSCITINLVFCMIQ